MSGRARRVSCRRVLSVRQVAENQLEVLLLGKRAERVFILALILSGFVVLLSSGEVAVTLVVVGANQQWHSVGTWHG